MDELLTNSPLKIHYNLSFIQYSGCASYAVLLYTEFLQKLFIWPWFEFLGFCSPPRIGAEPDLLRPNGS